MDPVTGSILLGAAVSGINAGATSNQNRVNRKFALQQWNRENAYNSPTAQMQRLRDAGLNPNLVYGGGATTLAAKSLPQSGDAPQFSTPNPMGLMAQHQDIKKGKAETDNLSKQAVILDKQAELLEVQKLKTVSEIPGITARGTIQMELAKLYPEMAAELLRGKTIDNENKVTGMLLQKDANFRAETSLENDTKRTLAQVMTANANASKVPYQKRLIEAQISNLGSSQLVNEIRSLGLATSNETLKMVQEGVIWKNKFLEGQITQQALNRELSEIKIRFKGMGLSESATSDLLKVITDQIPVPKSPTTVTHIKKTQ